MNRLVLNSVGCVQYLPLLCVHSSAQQFAMAKLPSNLKGRKKDAQEWLKRQFKDPYVHKAHELHYRARSAFKLIEINDKYQFLKPGHIVLDCGAAPGSWTQVVIPLVNADKNMPQSPIGKVIAVDKAVMREVKDAIIIDQSDFRDSKTLAKIRNELNEAVKFDVIVSDMAPSATGAKQLDHICIIELCLAVLSFAIDHLKLNGTMLCKFWDGSERKVLVSKFEEFFDVVKVVKPNASRDDSAEHFLLATKFIR